MAKKKYVYKIVPIKEIYLSEYEEFLKEEGVEIDEGLRVYNENIGGDLDVLELLHRIKDNKSLMVIIMMLLGYKPREIRKELKLGNSEVYNIIQRIRMRFIDKIK